MKRMARVTGLLGACAAALALAGCQSNEATGNEAKAQTASADPRFLNQPLITGIYTADPSVHVWEDGRIYIYPSHDIETNIPEDDLGSHFAMRDYHVFSMDRIGGEVTDHGTALSIEDVPWAGRQMWAPDAAYKDGTYYLYFPAKDKEDVFHIGVATSSSPTGPFVAEPQPIEGSYSMDPNVFKDTDGQHYMYFGGIWGGQLQKWANGAYDPQGSNTDLGDPNAPSLMPRIARMAPDMKSFAEEPREVMILDENGQPLLTGDNERRFFEGAWVFKRGDTYYLTYSTGDTHYLVYATGDNPYGPFTYRGRIMEPVQGWTTHHSIVDVGGQWYLFYHDTQLSGKTHLRNVKVTPLEFRPDGSIVTIDPVAE